MWRGAFLVYHRLVALGLLPYYGRYLPSPLGVGRQLGGRLGEFVQLYEPVFHGGLTKIERHWGRRVHSHKVLVDDEDTQHSRENPHYVAELQARRFHVCGVDTLEERCLDSADCYEQIA